MKISYKRIIILFLAILVVLTGYIDGKADVVYEVDRASPVVVREDTGVNVWDTEEVTQESPLEDQEVVEIQYYNIPLSKELQEYTYNLCEEYNLDFVTILGIMKLESNFKIDCVSSNETSDDLGLMQLNSRYLDWYAELAELENYDVFDPYDNIRMGVAGLANYKKYWKNRGYEGVELTKLMMLSYNRGVEGTKKYIKKYGLDHAYTKIALANREKILNGIE